MKGKHNERVLLLPLFVLLLDRHSSTCTGQPAHLVPCLLVKVLTPRRRRGDLSGLSTLLQPFPELGSGDEDAESDGGEGEYDADGGEDDALG